MSTGGLIAQAVLGATGSAAQGVGQRLREEAKLKRQKSLDKAQAQNDMQVQAHGSSLRIGEDNLNREHASGENQKDRDHRLQLADKQHDQAIDLTDYKLSGQLKLAREKAREGGKLTDGQNAYLERINGDIDHLQRMERELSTGKTGEFGEIGVVTPDNSGDKIKEIRQRIKAREIAFNRVLGGTRGTDPAMPILNQAAGITDPAERKEFMADLQGSRVYSDDLARSISEVWGAENQPAQQERQSGDPQQGARQTEQRPERGAQPGKKQGGLIAQAQSGQVEQPAAEQPAQQAPARPKMNDNVDMTPNNNSAQSLQDQIVSRSREEGRANYQKAAQSAQQEVEGLLASGELNSMDKNQRAAAIRKYGEYFKAMPPEVIEQLKAAFGDQAIDQYLN